MGDTRAAQRSSMSDACCVDRPIVGAVVGIQIGPSQGAAGLGQTERPKPLQLCNGTASGMGCARAPQRSSMSDAARAMSPGQCAGAVWPGRCGQGDAARAMRPGRCGQDDAARAIRRGRCGQGDAARAMRPGRCGQGVAARAMRPGRCDQDVAAMAMPPAGAMRPGRRGQGDAARAMRPGRCGQARPGTHASPKLAGLFGYCLLYTSPSPRDRQKSRMPSSA